MLYIIYLAGAKYNEYTDPLFYSLNTLPLPGLFYQRTPNFMHLTIDKDRLCIRRHFSS